MKNLRFYPHGNDNPHVLNAAIDIEEKYIRAENKRLLCYAGTDRPLSGEHLAAVKRARLLTRSVVTNQPFVLESTYDSYNDNLDSDWS